MGERIPAVALSRRRASHPASADSRADRPPLTAKLGEPGQRDSKGSGGSSSSARPITVTEAAGAVVYEKQTADNQKSADSHIGVVGCGKQPGVGSGYVRTWGSTTVLLVVVPAAMALLSIALAVPCGSSGCCKRRPRDSARCGLRRGLSGRICSGSS